MEVLRRYGRARAVTREHVSPANPPLLVCQQCPRVPGRALADVPVSYPRAVVCSQNAQPIRIAGVSSSVPSGEFEVADEPPARGDQHVEGRVESADRRQSEKDDAANEEQPTAAKLVCQPARGHKRRRGCESEPTGSEVVVVSWLRGSLPLAGAQRDGHHGFAGTLVHGLGSDGCIRGFGALTIVCCG